MSPELVGARLDAVLGDLPVRAVKTGVLLTTGTVRLVADRAALALFDSS